MIRLTEAAVAEDLHLDADIAAALVKLRVAALEPRGADQWRVSSVRKVGQIRVQGVQVRIEPKVPIRRLFHLLAVAGDWGDWFDESVDADRADELHSIVAQTFVRFASAALNGGVLRGYRTERRSEPTIRGRWLVAEQVRRRHGLPLPAELEVEEFTADIDENRLARSAARRLLGQGDLPIALRGGLLRIDRSLGEANLLSRGEQLPDVTFTRVNARYRALVGLSRLILTGGSFDDRVGAETSSGYLLDLPVVFERFVAAEVRRAAKAYRGRIIEQEIAGLDRLGLVQIRPDLVWRGPDGRVGAVLDAKYKAEKPAGYPNADIYQMLTYCIRHGVPTGHLVYAKGNATPASYEIEQAGTIIRCHALDLDATPIAVSRQIDAIVAKALVR